jgi:hypothetical protein
MLNAGSSTNEIVESPCTIAPLPLEGAIEKNAKKQSDDEEQGLRHTIGRVPSGVWAAAFISVAERLAYWAISTPWRM